ncbi:hypothetical protein [Bacteroides intestinalis]|uniref:hypothetical protein n=1 Tax=Bacteroides intestinalis TaxID=329854 RepID=UPI0011C2216C|nr:hypothetical protein [Bacteroides intestinalis]
MSYSDMLTSKSAYVNLNTIVIRIFEAENNSTTTFQYGNDAARQVPLTITQSIVGITIVADSE